MDEPKFESLPLIPNPFPNEVGRSEENYRGTKCLVVVVRVGTPNDGYTHRVMMLRTDATAEEAEMLKGVAKAFGEAGIMVVGRLAPSADFLPGNVDSECAARERCLRAYYKLWGL